MSNTINIALIGKPGSGKSKFICTVKGVPLTKYVKTMGFEAHPTPVGDKVVVLWEFGHIAANMTIAPMLEKMHGIIYITPKENKTYETDKPCVVVYNNRVDPFDTATVLNTIVGMM